jgi:hypothetical protein
MYIRIFKNFCEIGRNSPESNNVKDKLIDKNIVFVNHSNISMGQIAWSSLLFICSVIAKTTFGRIVLGKWHEFGISSPQSTLVALEGIYTA